MRFLEKFTSRQVAWLIVAILFATAVALWVAVCAATPRGVLVFAVMDVGQGDAIYIESPTGLQVVVDGGQNTAVLRELPKLMPYGDRFIDAVIATHPDADHIGGLVDLLSRYRVGMFIDPGVEKSTATARALKKKVETLHIAHRIARRGMVLDLGSGARLEILFPDYDVSTLASDNANEGGVVARLVYGESEALLMADVPVSVEEKLVYSKAVLTSDVLKVGHHGSRTSTSEALLEAARPQVAIISVGAQNRYGHPTTDVLDRLLAFGITVFRTDEKGTVRCISDGASFRCD